MKTIKITGMDEPVVVIFSDGDTTLAAMPINPDAERLVVVEDGVGIQVFTPEEYADKVASLEADQGEQPAG